MGKTILFICALVVAACHHTTAPAGPFPVYLLEVSQVEPCAPDTLCKVFVAGSTQPNVTMWSITGGFARVIPFSESLSSGYFNGVTWMTFHGGKAHILVCASEAEPRDHLARDCAEYRVGF